MTKKELLAIYGKAVVSRVSIRQIGGDDGFQWNVLVDGRPTMSGLTKREAVYEQERACKIISNRAANQAAKV